MLFNLRALRRRVRNQPILLWIVGFFFLIDSYRIVRSRGPTLRIGDENDPSKSIPPNPSVFVVSVHRNTEKILRAGWKDALLELAEHLGKDNVYVSAVESGSQDHTKDFLVDLDDALARRGIPRHIQLGYDVWGQMSAMDAWADGPESHGKGRIKKEGEEWVEYHGFEYKKTSKRDVDDGQADEQSEERRSNTNEQSEDHQLEQRDTNEQSEAHQLERRGVASERSEDQRRDASGGLRQAEINERSGEGQNVDKMPPGWAWHEAEKRYALRRIPYLASVRNWAMEALLEEFRRTGKRYDRILWINDVIFDTPDVLTLLHTRGGNYAAACAVDFKDYPLFYDTFAMRDAWGAKPVSLHWPWFQSAEARANVKAGLPVRVRSCWNGMVAFDAGPFYEVEEGPIGPDVPLESLPAKLTPKLKFRGVDDSLAEFHLEGSECCLIHVDNPLSEGAGVVNGKTTTDPSRGGVWVNPNVRVAYMMSTYHKVRRHVFPDMFMAIWGTWMNRFERTRSHVQFRLEGTTVVRRLRQWRAETPEGEPPRSEPGSVCLINEKQIMWQNGWKHL